MEKIHIPQNQNGEQDKDVEIFGGYASEDIRKPFERRISGGEIGKDRLNYAAGVSDIIPYLHFPNGEYFQHINFPRKLWQKYGNLEHEINRIEMMLGEHSNRHFPKEFQNIADEILSSENLFESWKQNRQKMKNEAENVYKKMLKRSEESKVYDETSASSELYVNYVQSKGTNNGWEGAYVSPPSFYEPTNKNITKGIWENSIAQISAELQNGDISNVGVFLEIYNRVKDPVTPVISNLNRQAKIFKKLYSEINFQEDMNHEALIVQLALESSFKALPNAENIFYTHLSEHHELPYIYTNVTSLPRSELANPKRVAGNADGNKSTIEELIDDAIKYGEEVVTPLAVSYIEAPGENPQMVILDGNNRATAILVMEYLDSINGKFDKILDIENIKNFIYDRNSSFDIEWERDLILALEELNANKALKNKLIKNFDIVRNFANSKIPALLGQEANFFTIDVAESEKPENMKAGKVICLQPSVQGIFNQKEKSMAIASKKQSHGRAKGNNIRLPILK